MRVFVTGGTGFVGPAIVRELVASGHDVTVMVHKTRGSLDGEPGVRFHEGDVFEPSTFAKAVHGHDAIVHLLGLRRAFPGQGRTFEKFHVLGTKNVLEAAREAGARRFLFMSASSVRPDGATYQRTKWQAEELVKASRLDWTIFRPTFITGRKEDKAEGFDQEMARLVKAPLWPSFAGGRFLVQPVAKRDVARAFAKALMGTIAIEKTYFLAGPDTFTWDNYLRALGKLLGKDHPLAPVPKWVALPAAGLFEGFKWFPASQEELAMLFEGHSGNAAQAELELGLKWTPWEEAAREALGLPAAGERASLR